MAELRKRRAGVVVSDKMDKTVVVAVRTLKFHRVYKKGIRRTQRYKAHDAENACRAGDEVIIEEMRPLSKDKRWRVIEIVARHELIRALPPEEEIAPEIAVPAEPATQIVVGEPVTEEAVEQAETGEEPALVEASPTAEAAEEPAEAAAEIMIEEPIPEEAAEQAITGEEPALVEATPTAEAASAEEMAAQAGLEAPIPEAEDTEEEAEQEDDAATKAEKEEKEE
jgi:small subunit ribosomal protein S17